MKIQSFIGISAISLIAGMLLFAYFQEWIVINYPFSKKQVNKISQGSTTTKKKAKLTYWHNNDWNTEEAELIWSNNNSENIQYLINSLLALMHDEDVMSEKIALESVMLSPNGQEAFISFERNPFNKESSTFEKWMIIESILKTINNSGTPIKSVRFLVRHKPAEDYHLDFSKSWPVNQN